MRVCCQQAGGLMLLGPDETSGHSTACSKASPGSPSPDTVRGMRTASLAGWLWRLHVWAG